MEQKRHRKRSSQEDQSRRPCKIQSEYFSHTYIDRIFIIIGVLDVGVLATDFAAFFRCSTASFGKVGNFNGGKILGLNLLADMANYSLACFRNSATCGTGLTPGFLFSRISASLYCVSLSAYCPELLGYGTDHVQLQSLVKNYFDRFALCSLSAEQQFCCTCLCPL